jgi:hypothetical protein
MIMKPLAILILTALPLLAGCYTTPGYYGGSYGYVSGSPYYYGRHYGYVYRPLYLGFGYPYAYKHHYRHSGVRSRKHPIHKGYSPHHRFHRPNFKSRPHFNRATGTYRGSPKNRFKQRSFSRHHYHGSGQGFRSGYRGTRQSFRGHRRGTGRSFGRGTSFGRGFRR